MRHSFEYFCKDYENIENYEKAKKDNFKGWHCHHRLETHTSDGERRLVNTSMGELKALNMYYNRPASELIFLTKSEHSSLHMKGENNPMRNEVVRKKAGETHKGKQVGEKNPFYGKHHTEESKKKMRESQKGKHIGNTATKGMHWYNNGKINKLCYECPPGFTPGRIKKP